MKKMMALLLALAMVCTLMACGKETVTLHCDGCGEEVQADPKMDESWIIFCSDCGEPGVEQG